MSRHLAALLPTFGLAALGACAGATEQDVFGESNATAGSSSQDGGGSSSSDSGSSSTDRNDSGSPPTPADASNPGECQQETEPNEDFEAASVLTTSVCGVLSGGSDEDFITFTLKPATTDFSITFEGTVRLLVYAGKREPIVIEPNGSAPIPVLHDTPYYVEVRSRAGGGTMTKWRVNVVQK